MASFLRHAPDIEPLCRFSTLLAAASYPTSQRNTMDFSAILHAITHNVLITIAPSAGSSTGAVF